MEYIREPINRPTKNASTNLWQRFKNGKVEQSYSFYIYGAAKTECPHETNQIPTSIG